MIAGASEDEAETLAGWSDEEIDAAIRRELDRGTSVKDLASEVALRTGRPRRAVYGRAVELRGQRSDAREGR